MVTGKAEPHRSVLLSIAIASILCGTDAVAAVDLQSEVTAGIAYTDNVTLASTAEESEVVYQLLPSFTLAQRATRMTSSVAYQMSAYRYDSGGENEVHNQFDGRTTIELDPENFLFDLGASRGQSIRDASLAIPRGTLPISANRVDRNEAYAGPSFRYPLGRSVTAAGSYQRSWVRYDDEPDATNFSTRDADSETVTFSFDNYRRERGMTWAVRYSSLETDYHVFVPWRYKQAVAELGAWVAQGLRIFVSGGKESAWDEPFDPSLEDTLWDAGLTKAAGERWVIELAAGERSFGNSRRGRVQFTFRRGSMSVVYNEEPTTQERNPYLRGGLFNPLEPDDFLADPGTPERFILKRLQWSAAFELSRTQLSFYFFDETREQRVLLDGTSLQDSEQSGVGISASRDLGARTNLRLGAGRSRRQFQPDVDGELTDASIAATYNFSPRSRLSLEYRYVEDKFDDNAVSDDGYDASTVSLLFTRIF